MERHLRATTLPSTIAYYGFHYARMNMRTLDTARFDYG
jgi:hypothetical protein